MQPGPKGRRELGGGAQEASVSDATSPSPLEPFRGMQPVVHPSAWIHRSAVLIGEVFIGPRVSVWPGVVLRGDQGGIHVGEESNLQDGTIAHATGGLSSVRVGARVTVGHRALLHGCTVADDCLVGMGAILLDLCVIEPYCVVGAGTVIRVGQVVPTRSLVVGNPARVVRRLSDEEVARWISHGHAEYLRLLAAYGAPDV